MTLHCTAKLTNCPTTSKNHHYSGLNLPWTPTSCLAPNDPGSEKNPSTSLAALTHPRSKIAKMLLDNKSSTICIPTTQREEISDRTKLSKRQKIGLTLQWPCIALPNQPTAQHATQSQIANFATWDKSTPPRSYLFLVDDSCRLLAVRFFLIPSFLSHRRPFLQHKEKKLVTEQNRLKGRQLDWHCNDPALHCQTNQLPNTPPNPR